MRTLAIVLFTLCVAVQEGVMYRWTDEDGNIRASHSLAAVPEKHRSSAVAMKVVDVATASSGLDDAEYSGSASIAFTPGGKIVASAVFDGKAERKAIIDTGSDVVVITTRLARALGYDVSNARKSWISTSSGRILAPMVRLDNIRIDEAVARGVQAAVIDFEGRGEVSAALGMSFLAGFTFQIDSPAGVFSISAHQPGE